VVAALIVLGACGSDSETATPTATSEGPTGELERTCAGRLVAFGTSIEWDQFGSDPQYAERSSRTFRTIGQDCATVEAEGLRAAVGDLVPVEEVDRLLLAYAQANGAEPPSVDGTAALSETFCADWTAIAAGPGIEDATSADRVLAAFDRTIAETSGEIGTSLSRGREAARQVVEVMAAFAYDQASFRSGATAAQRQQLDTAVAALLEMVAESTVAREAHRSCPGAPDPRFQLGCVAQSFGAVGSALGGDGADDPGAAPIDVLVEETLSTLPAGTTAERRERDGVTEVAYLDAAGRTTRIEEYAPAEGGVVRSSTASCR
jgi:hypothetical protein